MTNLRIGHGYDVHRLVAGRRLILGGVDIPWEKGLEGHSDADVLVHAVMDALLGAAGLEDIGSLFPDSSEEFRDISSLVLLERVAGELAKRSITVVNVDATVLAQAPKLAPYRAQMRANIAGALGIDEAFSWTLLWSLLVFNVGIEVVQLSIIAVVFPLLIVLRRRSPRAALWVTGLISAAVAAMGLIWFVQRLINA